MFGFGRVQGLNRTEYNTRVRNILENRIGIETDNVKNPNFPGALAFAQLVAEGWDQKSCPEDRALYIGIIYLAGCAKKGGAALDEAKRIDDAVTSYIPELAMSGKITDERARRLVAYYDENAWFLRQ